MTGISSAPRYQVERGIYSLADLMFAKNGNAEWRAMFGTTYGVYRY